MTNQDERIYIKTNYITTFLFVSVLHWADILPFVYVMDKFDVEYNYTRC